MDDNIKNNKESEYVLNELLDNIEELDSHQQEFIRSVKKFFDRTGFITQDQEEWLNIYYNQIEKSYED